MSLTFKLIKAATWEEWIALSFMFGKLGFLVLLVMNNQRLAIVYSSICLITWLVLRMPRYSGPSKVVRITSIDQFYDDILGYEQDELVLGLAAEKEREKQQKANKKLKSYQRPKERSFADMNSTLVVFTANWAENCQYLHTMWVKFANRFTTSKLRVVEIDAMRFSSVAKSFQVNHKDAN